MNITVIQPESSHRKSIQSPDEQDHYVGLVGNWLSAPEYFLLHADERTAARIGAAGHQPSFLSFEGVVNS